MYIYQNINSKNILKVNEVDLFDYKHNNSYIKLFDGTVKERNAFLDDYVYSDSVEIIDTTSKSYIYE